MLNYFLDHMTGVCAMAFNREGWEDNLDRSIRGVFRSFWLIVPCFIIVITLSFMLAPVYREVGADLGLNSQILRPVPGTILIFIKFLLEWFGSLGLLLFVAKKLDHQSYAADIVVGYNWLQMVLKLLFSFPLLVLMATRSLEISSLFTIGAMALSIALTWGVLRRAIPDVAPPITAGMMVGVFFVNILSQIILAFLSQPFLQIPSA